MPKFRSLVRRLRVGGGAALLAAGAAAQTSMPMSPPPPLALHYQERPPYTSSTAKGAVVGVLALPTEQALRRAGITFVWVRTPPARQLALIQQGRGLHCGIGWFRSPEREALGKFSREIYRDRPLGALVRDGSVDGADSAGELLARAAAGLIVKDGFSYGTALDAAIRRAPAPPIVTSADSLQVVRMIAAGRGSWTLMAPEEAQALLATPELAGMRLHFVPLADVAQGQTRHLYCNAAVPDTWIARFDRALATR